jgi:Flp pilus assembly protein TadG
MLRPLIQRRRPQTQRNRERGVTMALVAITMLAVISMAAISIDLGALFEAKAEAQRAADLGALAAARVISVEGITGDPTNGATDTSWGDICGGATSPASLAATTIAQQNLVNGTAAPNVKVYYGTDTAVGTNQDCTAAGAAFGVNPVIQVYVQQPTLPTYFARIFSLLIPGAGGNSGVSATATAEVYNSSGSASVGAGTMVPVQPRCVKPWIVANNDPKNSGGANPFVKLDGTIQNGGVFQINTGVIGETFIVNAACDPTVKASCTLLSGDNPPNGSGGVLSYIPALVSSKSVAIASNTSCSLDTSSNYQLAIAGCDQSTVYACGTVNGATADLTENPVYPTGAGDTLTGMKCLTNSAVGADSLAGGNPPTYPFEIEAGFGNPLVQAGLVFNNDIIVSSNSIVTVPIASFGGATLTAGSQPAVTIVGYLQLFIIPPLPPSGFNVAVLNVVGCSNSAAGNPSVTGTSPVPVRLITPP